MSELWVIGCYENPVQACFPLHVSPILVMRVKGGYQRIVYRIERPYRIKPVATTGPLIEHPTGVFFPHPSYMECPAQACGQFDQFLLLGPGLLYANSSRLGISARLFSFLCIKIAKGHWNECHRAWLTLRNVWD